VKQGRLLKADALKPYSFQCQCLRLILTIRWQQRITNKGVVEMAEINDMKLCGMTKVELAGSGERVQTTASQYWGGHQKVKEREGDQNIVNGNPFLPHPGS